ncbi:hypothetical protein [Rhodococcus sp. NPDC047139]|uniref:hypothetical protein n=1 Tax=Rhodococcus sp. NPDC047139 TaxID=3155141 RepID=UPI00340DABB3
MAVPNLTTASYPDLYAHLEGIVEAIHSHHNLPRSAHLDEEGHLDALRRIAASKSWASDVDAIDGELGRRITEAGEATRSALAALTARPTGSDAVAAELRATRFWQRTASVLDAETAASRPGAALVLVETVAAEDLATVLEELPSYLASRGVREIGGVDTEQRIEEALYRRLPRLGDAKRNEAHAQTMRSAFARMLGFIRESTADINAPMLAPVGVLKLAQVRAIDERHQVKGGPARRPDRAA